MIKRKQKYTQDEIRLRVNLRSTLLGDGIGVASYRCCRQAVPSDCVDSKRNDRGYIMDWYKRTKDAVYNG